MLRYPALRTNGEDEGEPVLIKQCPDEVSRDLNSDVLCASSNTLAYLAADPARFC